MAKQRKRRHAGALGPRFEAHAHLRSITQSAVTSMVTLPSVTQSSSNRRRPSMPASRPAAAAPPELRGAAALARAAASRRVGPRSAALNAKRATTRPARILHAGCTQVGGAKRGPSRDDRCTHRQLNQLLPQQADVQWRHRHLLWHSYSRCADRADGMRSRRQRQPLQQGKWPPISPAHHTVAPNSQVTSSPWLACSAAYSGRLKFRKSQGRTSSTMACRQARQHVV